MYSVTIKNSLFSVSRVLVCVEDRCFYHCFVQSCVLLCFDAIF